MFYWRLLLISIFISPFVAFSQTQFDKMDPKEQRLLLQLGAVFLNVARQNQIDMDSGLVLAYKRLQLSRFMVSGEFWDDILRDPDNSWIKKENINGAKDQLERRVGSEGRKLLAFIGSYYTFQTGRHPGDNDSAILYLTKAKEFAERAKDNLLLCQTLALFGKFYMETGDTTAGTSSFENAVRLADAGGFKKEKGIALFYWGAFSPLQMNTIANRIEHFRSAAQLFEQLGIKENEIMALTDLGYLVFAIGQPLEAKKSFLRVLELEKSLKFPFIHYTTYPLFLTAEVAGEFGTSLQYALEGIKAFEATGDSLIFGYLCHSMSLSLSINQAKENESNEWDKKSLIEFKRIGDMGALTLAAFNISNHYLNTNRPKEAAEFVKSILSMGSFQDPSQKQMLFILLAQSFSAQKDIPKTEFYLSKAISLRDSVSQLSGDINIAQRNYQIGIVYEKINLLKPARFYLEKALSVQSQLLLDSRQLAEKKLAQIDSAEGDFKSAYRHAINSMDLISIIANRNQVTENQSLIVQYETEKKDNHIKLLNQQSALQMASVKQATLTRNVFIGGATLLLLFLGLLYNQYRIKQKSNQQLALLVQEKEFLLKEIHHRVKNNLQIVISLLNTQSKYLDNDEALAAITESKHRMQAMSLIHQKLYQSDDVSFVGMQGYIRELVDYLQESFGGVKKIQFKLNIEELDLDISQAIPIGLILNEAITNCIQHAFDSQMKCIVAVQMNLLDNNMICLEIADNGKGMSSDQDLRFSQSMGMRLIRGLTEQIGGTLTINSRNGFILSTTFPKLRILQSA
jgi:two-component system, sensor histidine kinase PdtaS